MKPSCFSGAGRGSPVALHGFRSTSPPGVNLVDGLPPAVSGLSASWKVVRAKAT